MAYDTILKDHDVGRISLYIHNGAEDGVHEVCMVSEDHKGHPQISQACISLDELKKLHEKVGAMISKIEGGKNDGIS